MELLFAIQEDARRTLHRQRIFRDRTNVLETYDDLRLIKDFRFPRATILQIVEMCQNLERRSSQQHVLPVHLQVLGTLRLLARGAFQDDCKDILGVSQPSVSRMIHDVCEIICQNARQYISFPLEEDIAKKEKFYRMNGVPNVLGVIDGTHICITSPSGPTEPLFVCRKGGRSINVQLVCDPNYMIIDIVVKFPGSTHDSFIWNSSGLRSNFVNQQPNGWLIGDSGYPFEPWLLIPYEAGACTTLSHQRYNRALSSTRSLVERTIGLWKSVFRRIDKSGGIMMYTPEKACKFILASAVLHNMRRRLNLPEDVDFIAELRVLDIDDNRIHAENSDREIICRGNLVRDTVRNGFFNS